MTDLERKMFSNGGAPFVKDTESHSGNFYILQVIEAVKFTSLTPKDERYMGTADGNGNDIDSTDEFPPGEYEGWWTEFELASGKLIAHEMDDRKKG